MDVHNFAATLVDKIATNISDKMRKLHISLLGNIGSGKSSVLRRLIRCKNMTTGDEPMEEWENSSGENLLQMYYDDPKQWAFVFQTKVMATLRYNYNIRINLLIKF